MKQLVLFTFLILLIMMGACSMNDAVPEEPEYPIIMGTWQINSPSQANWIGVQSAKAKTDTTFISKPDGQLLSVAKIHNGLTTALQFVDSTFTVPDTTYQNEHEGYYIAIDFPREYIQIYNYFIPEEGFPISGNTPSLELPVSSNCNLVAPGMSLDDHNTLPPPTGLQVTITIQEAIYKFGEGYTLYPRKVYLIDVTGLKEVVDLFTCTD